MLILLIGVALAGDCPDGPATTNDLVDAIESGLEAFSNLDEKGFEEAYDLSHQRLGCVETRMFARHASAFHRMNGIHAFFLGHDDEATEHFRAALATEPSYELRTSIAPMGGKLDRLYNASKEADEPKSEAFEVPDGFELWVNAKRSDVVLTDMPMVVQVYDPEGLRFTGWVDGREALPSDLFGGAVSETPVVADAEPEPEPGPKPDPKPEVAVDPQLPEPLPTEPRPSKDGRSGGKMGLVAAAAGTGVAAVGLFAGSAAMRSKYDQAPTSQLRQRTNGVYVASVGAAAVSLTLGGIAVVLP